MISLAIVMALAVSISVVFLAVYFLFHRKSAVEIYIAKEKPRPIAFEIEARGKTFRVAVEVNEIGYALAKFKKILQGSIDVFAVMADESRIWRGSFKLHKNGLMIIAKPWVV